MNERLTERPMTRTPLVLGVAGLIPFGFLAILVVTGWEDQLGWSVALTRTALLGYGAVIASFLGGIRWGLALSEPREDSARDFVLSVVPSLLGWAILLLPGPMAFVLLGLLLLGWGIIDQDVVRRGRAPAWFGHLRLMLSVGAGLSMLTAALG